ncbi:MAG: hypothetical protein AUG49_13040 [Catenulispora sp. 13_1_20CM_3_70_7]|nr:MAG: hypothetical protein AUG49_13040 [Catenulispora sp. 13_1_20CM_3_70_7]
MSLTVARFNTAVGRLHRAAKDMHRHIGFAQPVLMLVPDVGESVFVVLPGGTPKSAAGAPRCGPAREFGSAAAAISAES